VIFVTLGFNMSASQADEVEKLSTLDDESGEKALNNGGSEDENKKEKA
jgi:hypothetical protein